MRIRKGRMAAAASSLLAVPALLTLVHAAPAEAPTVPVVVAPEASAVPVVPRIIRDEVSRDRPLPTTTTTTTLPATTATTTEAPSLPATTRMPTESSGSGSYSMSDLMRRIGGCESNGAPYAPLAWTKWNDRGSGANGAFQDKSGTWQGWEQRFGTDGYSFTAQAADAPPAEQVWVNQHALDSGGTGPWVSSESCWR